MRFFWTVVLNGMALAALAEEAPAGQTAANPGDQMWSFFLMMGSIFAIFYFLMIRPSRNRSRNMKNRSTR